MMRKGLRKACALILVMILLISFAACSNSNVQTDDGATPEPTQAVNDGENQTTPEATATTEPAVTSEPTSTSEPTLTLEPTTTVDPTVIVEPTATVEPTVTTEPTATAAPTATVEPTVTVAPTATTAPTSTPTPTPTTAPTPTQEVQTNKMRITIGEYVFTATLAQNSSTDALKELLREGPITIEMSDYGNFEKVGSIGARLPRNDEDITTTLGDIILYQGTSMCIYYSQNTWNFTRLGWVDDTTNLREALGSGDVTVVLTLGE